MIEMQRPPVLSMVPNRRYWIMIAGILAYGHFFVTLQFISAMTTSVMESLAINSTETTLLVTAGMIGFGIMTIIGGPIGTKWGARNAIVLGLVVNCIANLLYISGMGESYAGVAVLRFLSGCGGGLISGSVIGNTMLWFPSRSRGIATGVFFGLVCSAFSVTFVLSPVFLAAGVTWQLTCVYLGAIPAAVIAILYFTTCPDIGRVYPGATSVDDLLPPDPEFVASQQTNSVEKLPKTIMEVLSDKRVLFACIVILINGWLQHGLATEIPQLLIFDYKMSAAQVSTITSGTFIAYLIFCPLSGIICDKFLKGRRYPIMSVGALLSCVFFLILPYVPVSALGITLFLAYGTIAAVTGVFFSVGGVLVESSMIIFVSALFSTLGTLGGLVGSPVMNIMAVNSGTYMTPIYLCAVLGIVGAVAPWFIKK